jgi:hypothetical protein
MWNLKAMPLTQGRYSAANIWNAGTFGRECGKSIDRRTAAPGMARRRLPPNRADFKQPNGDQPGAMADEPYAKWVTSARRATNLSLSGHFAAGGRLLTTPKAEPS